MDACACAASIKHHSIKDAAVVRRSTESGQDTVDVVVEIHKTDISLT